MFQIRVSGFGFWVEDLRLRVEGVGNFGQYAGVEELWIVSRCLGRRAVRF